MTPIAQAPAERAGRSVDNAARNTADAAHDAANRTGTVIDNAAARTGNAVDNAAARTSNAANDAANRTSTAVNNTATDVRSGASSTWSANGTTNNTTAGGANATQPSNVPGLPSVNGTSTNNMSTADAAAQRLIDNARNNIKQNDYSKARTLLSELKDKGMYDSLSAPQKANVDQLEKDINAGAATAQENK